MGIEAALPVGDLANGIGGHMAEAVHLRAINMRHCGAAAPARVF